MKKLFWLAMLLSLTVWLLLPISIFATDAPSSMSINNVYVWRNLQEANDMLVVATESVNYAANPDDDISLTFLFRFLSANLTTEYGSVQAYPYFNDGYGRGVVSWYFSAANAPAWAGNYTIRIEGKTSAFDSPPKYSYQISSSAFSSYTESDDIEDDIYSKMVNLCHNIEAIWGNNYTLLEDSDMGLVLSSQGQSYFRGAIPNLQSVCPSLFLVSSEDPESDSTTWTNNESTTWETKQSSTAFGNRMQGIADLFSVSFLTMAAIPIIIFCIVLIVIGAMTGNVLSGFMNAGTVLIPASYYGWFPPVAMILIAFASGLYILWHLFGKVHS